MSKAKIYYHDIGDYLSRKEKLATLKKYGSVNNMQWKTLTPNEHGDWISQRDDIFETYISLESEKKFEVKTKSIFVVNSRGNETSRDAWIYNFSFSELKINMQRTVEFYNFQLQVTLKLEKRIQILK